MKRFWNKVNKTKNCWNWTGCIRGKSGYGCIKFKGKTINTHRFSWILHFGEIPKEMFVCHKCDNRLCVNPKHLFLGTPKDNAWDAINKGRMSQKPKVKNKAGIPNIIARKLNTLTSEEIRNKFNEIKISKRKLAKIYNVDEKTIRNILKKIYY